MLDQEDGTLTSFLQVAAAGGITSTIGYFLGFGPIGAVAGGLHGATRDGCIRSKKTLDQKMGLYEQYAREAIQHVMREVNLRVQEQVQANRQMVRKLLGTELSTLETVLDQALHENSQSIEVMATFTKVRTQLQEFRERLQSNNA